MTCAKTQGFLARHKVTVATQRDAKKATIKGDAALGVLRDDASAWRSLALLSGAAGAAFLSRVTFGLPLYALASGLALRLLVLQLRRDRRPLLSAAGRVALALFPAIAAGLFQLWYNHARFGSPFEFAPIAAKGVESALHWSRMPSGALA